MKKKVFLKRYFNSAVTAQQLPDVLYVVFFKKNIFQLPKKTLNQCDQIVLF